MAAGAFEGGAEAAGALPLDAGLRGADVVAVGVAVRVVPATAVVRALGFLVAEGRGVEDVDAVVDGATEGEAAGVSGAGSVGSGAGVGSVVIVVGGGLAGIPATVGPAMDPATVAAITAPTASVTTDRGGATIDVHECFLPP